MGFGSATGVGRRDGNGPLRVALFSGNYNCVTDGANQALNRLVRHLLDEEGAAVRVYSPVGPQPAFVPAGELVPVPSVGIPMRPEYRIAVGFPEQVRADLLRFRPDVIHLSAPDLLGAQAQSFARRIGLPVVTSLHTRFETYLDYYKLGFLRGWVTRYLGRFYTNSDLVLVPNQPIADDMGKESLSGRVRIWSRGVDRTIFSPARRSLELRRGLGYADDETVLLFFGRLVKEKGLHAFADAVDGLRQRGLRVRPLVVGEGPAHAEMAERLGDAVFAGHQAGADLGTYVASGDILYNPSTTEAFGNVTLEAMSAGLVAVCPDVASARALITNQADGVLLPDQDRSTAIDAIADLFGRPDHRRQIGESAAAHASAFSWAAANGAVVDAYRDAIAAYRPPLASTGALATPLRQAA